MSNPQRHVIGEPVRSHTLAIRVAAFSGGAVLAGLAATADSVWVIAAAVLILLAALQFRPQYYAAYFSNVDGVVAYRITPFGEAETIIGFDEIKRLSVSKLGVTAFAELASGDRIKLANLGRSDAAAMRILVDQVEDLRHRHSMKPR